MRRSAGHHWLCCHKGVDAVGTVLLDATHVPQVGDKGADILPVSSLENIVDTAERKVSMGEGQGR